MPRRLFLSPRQSIHRDGKQILNLAQTSRACRVPNAAYISNGSGGNNNFMAVWKIWCYCQGVKYPRHGCGLRFQNHLSPPTCWRVPRRERAMLACSAASQEATDQQHTRCWGRLLPAFHTVPRFGLGFPGLGRERREGRTLRFVSC